MFHRTEDLLQTAVADINVRDVDLVIVGGDLVSEGSPSEFDKFDEIVTNLGAETMVIPGNHDIRKESNDERAPTAEAFSRRYNDDTYPVVRSQGNIDVVGLNSASMPDGSLSNTWAGRISEPQLEWLAEMLPTLSDPVVTVHHNLRPQEEHVDEFPWNQFPVSNAKRVQRIVKEGGASLVISGHHHIPSATEQAVPEVIAPAVCSFPQGYLLIEISPDGTSVHLVPLAHKEQMNEAYFVGKQAEPAAQGIMEIAESRLRSLPLVDQWR